MNVSVETQGSDAGLFGRPLFEDPSARALARVGVVDVGSNSVRMVVFDGAARSPAYFYNEKNHVCPRRRPFGYWLPESKRA